MAEAELLDDDTDDTKFPTTKKPIKGRKGVKYEQSVSPKKGAPPENNKPSVVPRKDADPSQLSSSDYNVSPIVTLSSKLDTKGKSDGTVNKSMPPSINMPPITHKKKTFTPKLTETSMNFGSALTGSDVTVTPSVSLGTTVPSVDISNKGEPPKPPISIPTSTEGNSLHLKPTAATDSKVSQSPSDDDVSYTPAVVGLVLLVVIMVTIIVVGYRRLQDVWMRRHYARMDFLIDGMYDV